MEESYSRNKVNEFIAEFNEEGMSTQANFAFVYISQYLEGKEHGLFGGSKVVRKFEALNPWEKANVFFELAPHFHGLLLESAKALTERAREVDALPEEETENSDGNI